MKNPIYASTGAFLGMANGYNYSPLPELAPRIKCDGFEFMVYSAWYADFENVINEVAGYGISFPVIH
ncbi:MAG: sugar phosphate isomerase/epimerase, partial [Clostridia bacterium]|nr:sugar phosphate isomerase/epimerase [Clostridia bacterium]